MPVKRRNHGRQKTHRGATNNVHCVQCGALVAKDKAISRASNSYVIEQASMDDLRQATLYEQVEVPTFFYIDSYCVSCACHLKIVRVRSTIHRKDRASASRAHAVE